MRDVPWVVGLSLVATMAIAQEKTIEPGLYEVVTTSSMGPGSTVRQCLTTKDIVNGWNAVPDTNCKRVRNVVAGGKLDFAATCPDMAMTMTGSYTPTSYAIDGKLVMQGDDPMTIETHIVAKRVAEVCKPG